MRIALGVGLAVLIAVGIPRRPAPGEPIRVDASVSPEALAEILAADTAADLTWADSVAPTRAVSTLLAAAAAAGGRVTVRVPAGAGGLRVEPPVHAVARRRAPLVIEVSGPAGTDVPVTITADAGATDSLVVPIGEAARSRAVVAVEPTRAGHASWTVRTAATERVVHAWVRPEASVRVLVWTGPPSWESRWLVRALESVGMDVVVRQDLGRNLAVTSAEGAASSGTSAASSEVGALGSGAGLPNPPTDAPTSLDDLTAWDVLAFVGAPDDETAALVLRWVAERGGGLLIAGPGEWPASLDGWAPGDVVERPLASVLEWAGPAEVVPLPSAEIAVRAISVPSVEGGPAAGAAPVVSTTSSTYARAGYLGRGRVLTSGIETWPWVMEAGHADAHAAYWESVVEWLASGLTADVALHAPIAQPRVRWTGHLEGEVPGPFGLSRPGGSSEPDGQSEIDARSGSAVPASEGLAVTDERAPSITFVPSASGAHGLAPITGAAPIFGAIAAPHSERLSWTAAALEIGRAGGRVVPARRTTAEGTAQLSTPASPSRTLRWLLFLGLAALATIGWATRRVSGRP